MLLAGNPLIKIEASSLFSIYMGKPVAYGKQNSVLENFIMESGLPFAQINSIHQNENNKTKQSSTSNKLTEIRSEKARYITRLLGQTDNFESSFRLVIKLFSK